MSINISAGVVRGDGSSVGGIKVVIANRGDCISGEPKCKISWIGGWKVSHQPIVTIAHNYSITVVKKTTG